MSRENAAHRLSRFKDDNGDDGIFVQNRHSSPLTRLRLQRAILVRPLFASHPPLPFSPFGRPADPLTKTNGRYLFRGTAASGFLLSPLCITLVKHFSAFSFPFIPLFVLGLRARPRFSVHPVNLSPRYFLANSSSSNPYFPSSIYRCANTYIDTIRRSAKMFELSEQLIRD